MRWVSGRPRIVAFVDESGDRGLKLSATPHFILGAIALPENRRHEAARWLAEIRPPLRLGPQGVLAWKAKNTHADRLLISRSLGAQPFGRVQAVVTCKRHLSLNPSFTSEHLYLFALRMMLERLTWLAEAKEMDVHCTVAHIRGLSKKNLRDYVHTLRTMPTQVKWDRMSSEPIAIDRPEREELLQIADVTASAIGAAFNPDTHGSVESRYIHEFAARLNRGRDDRGDVFRYGLKMHPWRESTEAAYPWVAAL